MQLLFICTGNICRSPFAELLAQHLAHEAGLDGIQCVSAGTHAVVGGRCPDLAVTVGREFGVELTTHMPQQVTESLLDDSQHILVMERFHRQFLLEVFEGVPSHRIHLLSDFAPGPHKLPMVPDPYGGERWAYQASYRLLDVCVRRVLDALWQQKLVPRPAS